MLAWLFAAAPVFAQTIDTGAITAVSTGSNCAVVAACANFTMANATINSVTLQVTGTFTGTLLFEATSDNLYNTAPNSTSVVWNTITGVKLSDGSASTGFASVAGTNEGQFSFRNSGLLGIRVRATAWTSGTAVVTAVRGYSGVFLPPFSSGSPVPATSGGTGFSSYAVGDLLTADTTTSLSKLADVAAGSYLRSGGVSTVPLWSTLTLPNAVTTGDILHASGSNAIGALADIAVGSVLVSGGVGAVSAWSATPSVTDLTLASAGTLGWSTDLKLVRDAANTLAQRNGTNPQTFRIYSTTDAGISNYERGSLDFTTTANRLSLVTTAAGTGVSRDIQIRAGGNNLFLGASGALQWQITTGGLLAIAGNTYDICASATPCRSVFAGTSVVSPILQGSGTGTTVANVGANSCGTTTATIAGNQISGVITVGATAGTQCRVTFSTAAPVARDCTVTDSTTTVATRATVVDTSNTDFLGAFVAGDKITYQCTVR